MTLPTSWLFFVLCVTDTTTDASCRQIFFIFASFGKTESAAVNIFIVAQRNEAIKAALMLFTFLSPHHRHSPECNYSIPLLLAGLWWDHPRATRWLCLRARRRQPWAFKAPLKADCGVSQRDSWIPLKKKHTHTPAPTEVKQSLGSESALVINSLSHCLQGPGVARRGFPRWRNVLVYLPSPGQEVRNGI